MIQIAHIKISGIILASLHILQNSWDNISGKYHHSDEAFQNNTRCRNSFDKLTNNQYSPSQKKIF